MLNISKRIEIIESLLRENTDQSLSYAALESRLTIEYLCYERFKLSYSYLSAEDLKQWQPKHIVKQVSEEIDEHISNEFTVSVCSHESGDKLPETQEDFESLEYTHLGKQSALAINKLHKSWHALSRVALHIPVPDITSGELSIYGDKNKIRKQVKTVVEYLSNIDGTILMGGSRGEVFSFPCVSCEYLIKKPVKYLSSPSVVNCINPKCHESYRVESDSHGQFGITRMIFKFGCKGCNNELEIPSNLFKDLRSEVS